MQDNEILHAITETITDKPVYTTTVSIKRPVPIPKRSIWDRLRKKPIIKQETERTFTINPCVVGNMYRIAGKAIDLPDEVFQGTISEVVLPLIYKHINDIVYIIAAGIQNDRDEPDQELINFIKDNFESQDLFDALQPVLENIGMQSFLNTIALAKGSVKILKPKASPLDGSELIASHTAV
ncbi:hypothetical protein ACJVDH_00405 [Pedobacter sp. AW1-32]|uniref:hypothetical protein n=1 Tax=Pedobacter sp. AW1-32 TaxID=3383026 RepID=UPI003FED481E